MNHLAGYTLVPANPDQVLLSRKRQISEWARGLSEEQFLGREANLEKQEHASDGKMTVWILVPRDDPQTLDFRCSCETFRRQALVLISSTNLVEKVTAYGIASVFCPPHYRKKGYASHMMRLLHHVLSPAASLPPFPKEWGAPPPPHPNVGEAARFSVLYSDVGEFYKYCGPSPHSSGWHIQGPISTTWALGPEDTNRLDNTSGDFNLLSEEKCREVWEEDAAYLATRFSQLPPSPRTRFTFLPNNGLAAFLVCRAESHMQPRHWGVSIPHKNGSPPVYATWTLDTTPELPPVLVVTRLRATAESLPELVKALITAARNIGANVVEVWNLDATLVTVAGNLGGRTGVRQEHLPAVAWYGPEHPNDVEWTFNEKFPWC